MNVAEADHDIVRATCASRASALAMTQTRRVAAQLATRGIATTILNVTTTGDRVADVPFAQIGSTGVFVKEVEDALRDGRADYGVHSCKDLASRIPSDMHIAAISRREDPRDAFCSERHASFASLPSGASVGTSSLRRRALLAALRPDLRYEDLRGNVDTRLRKLREGGYDAIVLAMAGLNRLDLHARYTVAFDIDELVPAAGQGALAIETRADRSFLAAELSAALNDSATELAVRCERAALAQLEGGCRAPIGLHARHDGAMLRAIGAVASADGTRVARAAVDAEAATPESAERLGLALADALRADGATAILAEIAALGV